MEEMAQTKTPLKSEVRSMAKEAGIELSHMVNVAKPVMKSRNKTKAMLIRELQIHEGNSACYNTGVSNCVECNCTWFAECQK